MQTLTVGQLTLEEIDREIEKERAYRMRTDNAFTLKKIDEDIATLLVYRREADRKTRHTTPPNKTRLGDLWPTFL